MKKTKIEFSDIQAGDLLETVYVAHGVKEVLTGIAFEKKERKTGFTEWWTSQGGTLIDTAVEYDAIYRIDVREASVEVEDDESFYGGDKTLHNTGTVDVQLNKDGDVVAVWFRCRMLPFTQSLTAGELPKQGHGSIKGIIFEGDE